MRECDLLNLLLIKSAGFMETSRHNILKEEMCHPQLRIDRVPEMKFDAPTNAGKRVSSNIANARNQRYKKDSMF